MIKLFRKKNKDEENEAKQDPIPEKESESLPEERGVFQRLRLGLSKTRSTLSGRLDRLILGKKEITDELLEELEEILLL